MDIGGIAGVDADADPVCGAIEIPGVKSFVSGTLAVSVFDLPDLSPLFQVLWYLSTEVLCIQQHLQRFA
jgi:hypothetical protein